MIVLHTVVVRYSLLLESLKAWVISRTDLETYKENLFNIERIQNRYKLFKNFTLPSLAQQKSIKDCIKGTNISKLQVFLVTSEELPNEHKKELDDLLKEYKWLNVRYLSSKEKGIETVVTDYIESLYAQVREPILYSNIRLDDDDILSVDFLDRLNSYVTEENIGRAITFANGYYGVYDSKTESFTQLCDLFSPKLALGLALVNKYDSNGYASKIKSIYGAGNHNRIDRRIPTITDGRAPSYIRTVHMHADSLDEATIQRYLKNNNLVHPIKVMQTIGMSFPISFDDLPLDIIKNEERDLKVYDFHLGDKKSKLNLPIQICIWRKSLLVQICKYKPKEYVKLELRKNNKVLTELSNKSRSELKITIPLEDSGYNKISETTVNSQKLKGNIKDANFQELILNISILIGNKTYYHEFKIT